MRVESDDLERYLARLTSRAGNKKAGLYGPGTVSWEVNREAIVMLGGGAAALLQLAHPFVAHAVDQHSHTKTDPIGRFQRTFANVFAMVFGDLDHAVDAARRVHALHTTIRGVIKEDVGAHRRGDRYQANDPHALMWVHATLLKTALDVYEQLVAPLTALEREAYYAEGQLFAHLFGIPDDVRPPTYEAFLRYWDETIASGVIAVGEPALELRRFLFRAPTRAHAPAIAWYEVFTAAFLPEKLQAEFDLPFGPRERAIFTRTLPLVRAAHRLAPRRLRYFPAYIEARSRLSGRHPHDYIGRWMEKVALRSINPRYAT